jgi:RHS repeat-associated protein
MVDPDMGAWRYTYDPLGNLIAQTDAVGVVTRLEYDRLNRLTHKAYELPAGSATAATPATSYAYDQLPDGSPVQNGIGRRVQMSDGAGSVTWGYDLQGRVTSEARTFSGAYAQLANTQDGGAYLTRYEYNAADWVTAVTYPDGERVTTGYTRRGLMQWQAGSMVGDIVLDTTYNALGQMTSQTTGDGLTTTYEYYPAHLGNHRLLQMRVGEGELHLAYTYDKASNINAIYDASRGVMGERIAYRYDHLDRLVSAKNEGGTLAGYTLAYEYDAVGNLTARSAAGQATHYHYLSAQPHAVSHVGDDRYLYDTNGNMITRTEDGVTYTQRWNAFNKLASVTWQRDGSACKIQFIYDGDGNRLLKVTEQAGQETTTYYAGRMFEKQFNTTVNRLGEGALSSGNCAGATHGVTDYGFTGQRNEAEFGLMDFNARYYSPRLGRFISPNTIVPDPLKGDQFNRYAFARGNPLKYIDPSGHIAICFQGGFNTSTEGATDNEITAGALQMCTETLGQAGYDQAAHGAIHYLNNGVNAIEFAYNEILKAKATNPAEPILITGYSWGGAAALDLAHQLSGAVPTPWGSVQIADPIPVNLLFLIDPEEDFRGSAPWLGVPASGACHQSSGDGCPIAPIETSPNTRWTQLNVPSNVMSAYNIWATQESSPEWLPQNGMNHIEGALNIGLAEIMINGNNVPVTHGSIVYTAVGSNPKTREYMAGAMYNALWWGPQ